MQNNFLFVQSRKLAEATDRTVRKEIRSDLNVIEFEKEINELTAETSKTSLIFEVAAKKRDSTKHQLIRKQ